MPFLNDTSNVTGVVAGVQQFNIRQMKSFDIIVHHCATNSKPTRIPQRQHNSILRQISTIKAQQ